MVEPRLCSVVYVCCGGTFLRTDGDRDGRFGACAEGGGDGQRACVEATGEASAETAAGDAGTVLGAEEMGLTYVCLIGGRVERASFSASSLWTATEKRFQKAGSRTTAIVLVGSPWEFRSGG
jgi:hypothetical protein